MNDTCHTHRTPKPRAQRPGSVYLAVMGVAMIVSIIGMLSMQVARLQLKSTTNSQNLRQARLLALAGVEYGMANMETYSDWRAQITHGAEKTPPLTLGNGTLTYALVDDDGNLNDNAADMVRIRGIGRVGDAVHVTSTLLEPAGSGLTCLEAAFCTNGQIEFSNGATWVTNQFICTNKSGLDVIDKTGSGILNGNAEAVGTIWNQALTGTATEGIAPRQMPDPTSVFDYYIANGTLIAASSIPSLTIDKQLISPASNPYGSSTNPLGIYVIDCGGGDITIQDSRILGTIILLNAGASSTIDKDIHWQPFVFNYPALMVQGNIEMKWRGFQNLRESQHNMNFNPPGTPYQGITDADEIDEYPPIIKGIVYVSGLMTVQNECHFDGVIVTDSVDASASLSVNYNGALLTNPPPGFAAGSVMQIVPGTWRREAY